ncbi:uncharacterized protein TNCV_1775711 [Trichonephila clavipes]|nr:uncharacterized protein TNCV_1775711 [Trichonephila clavipes]
MMETVGMVRIFQRSLSHRSVRYTSYIGDGDSKTFSSITASNPYGEDITVSKIECVGHVQKEWELLDLQKKRLNDFRTQVKSAYQSNSAITDIDVTFDGTWLTRGHSSQIGVGCVIDLLTGFVMDFEIMPKRCIECEHAKSGLGENSAEFHVWYESRISSCAINHVESSCAMEQEAALKLWQRSEDNGFRYTTLLSDAEAITY